MRSCILWNNYILLFITYVTAYIDRLDVVSCVDTASLCSFDCTKELITKIRIKILTTVLNYV